MIETPMPYYDHEAAYRRIAESGGAGWDDLSSSDPQLGSYDAVDAFLQSPLANHKGDALDLGCGGGQVSIKLAAHGYRPVGVDFAPSAIALAKRNAPELTFMVGDCLALVALPDASFDLVIDNHVLHCILGEDRPKFLGEVARVLRPNGLLFSETMSREGHVDFERHGIDPTTFRTRNRYLVSESELDSELAKAGFDIVTRDRRVDHASAIGDNVIRVASRRTTG